MSYKRYHAEVSTSGAGNQPASPWMSPNKGGDLASEETNIHRADEAQEPERRRTSKITDGAESDASSDQASRTRKKAEPVKSACVQCQKRKTKCSGQRPVCRFCNDRNLECSWDIGDGLTRTADLKRKLQEANVRSEDLDTLVEAMRFGSDEVSTMLLARLRLGEPVGKLATCVRVKPSPTDRDRGSMQLEAQMQELERTGNDCKPSVADYPTPASPAPLPDWSASNSQMHHVQSSSSWNTDVGFYQPNNSQTFYTPDFDQSQMAWRRNNSIYSNEPSPGHNPRVKTPHVIQRNDSGVLPQVTLVPKCHDVAHNTRRDAPDHVSAART